MNLTLKEKIVMVLVIISFVMLLSTATDIVYINDNNEVVQINNRKLIDPRPLNNMDIDSRILHIDTLK